MDTLLGFICFVYKVKIDNSYYKTSDALFLPFEDIFWYITFIVLAKENYKLYR